MNPNPTQTQPDLSLDPDTLATLLRHTVDALPHRPGASADDLAVQQRAASIAITALRPRDPLEAFLAARIVAFQHHLMDNLHSATQPDLPTGLKLRLQGRALALGTLMDRTVFELRDRQTTPALRAAAQLPASPLPASGPTPSVPAPHAQPAPEAAPASPPQPPPAEARHARRRRERAERHLAALASASARRLATAAAQSAGIAPAAPDQAPHQRLMAEVAARAAVTATALAA